jgi:nucleoid-associated protein YgaU
LTTLWDGRATGIRVSKDTAMKKAALGLLAGLLVAIAAFAADVALKAGHPEEYVVQRGDTLWDISGRFLEKPWLWPEIWHANPQIENPHLIYPGDRLSLVYVDGQARLMLNRGKGGVVKLSPQVRSSELDDAIPAIPLEEINAFMSRSRVVNPGELEAAPYVLAGALGHIVTAAGDQLHARGPLPEGERNFGIFRGGQTYVDPDTGEVLGIEARDIGSVRLLDVEDDVSTHSINRSREEIRVADRLLPVVEQKITATFFPSAPEKDISGVILAVEGGVTQVGRLDVVVLNRGVRDGLVEGNVLAIDKRGETTADPMTNELVKLPDTRAGMLMVFQSFEKLSLALVLEASQPLKVMDKVVSP